MDRLRERSGFLLLQGRGTSPGLACGPLAGNRADLDPEAARGTILVAERATPDDVGRILTSAGTLTLGGALLSHVSLLSREFGRPSVALGAGDGSRARMAGGGGPELLELLDLVGADAPAVLDEGDVVLLDGERGTVRVPGGADRDLRRRARRVHEKLSEWARLPDARSPDADEKLEEVLESAGSPSEAPFAYLTEAAFVLRLLPPGAGAARLLEFLRADRRRWTAAEPQLLELAAEIRGRAVERLLRARDGLLAAASPEELDRLRQRLDSGLERDRTLLTDLSADTDEVERLFARIRREADSRRTELIGRLRTRVSEALGLPDESLRHKLGGLFRLVREAGAARLDEGAVDALRARLREQVARERARAGHHLVVALDSEGLRDRGLVGGKAGALMEIRAVLPEGCRVPRGIVITSAAYRLHLLGETGEKLLQACRTDEDEAAVSRRARAAILSGEIPPEVIDAVSEALPGLGPGRLAVRSSATVEDGPTGSLAGQFDTVLGVQGLQQVLDRVRQTWASLWNARAIRALRASGQSPLRASQAVLVQEFVDTVCAGVLVTRDPTGRPDAVLVNASWGLGEGISQGEVSGDLFWVGRMSGELLASESGHGAIRLALDPDRPGTVEVPLRPEETGRPCLSAGELARLAGLARVLEEATGRAQDVEFGFARDGTLTIFQVRRLVAPRAT